MGGYTTQRILKEKTLGYVVKIDFNNAHFIK